MSTEKRVEINWIRSIGSALGAVSAAVLLSTLGVAGTLIGAALGSLCITVGGALYASSLEATKDRVLKTTARTADRNRPRANRDPQGVPDDLPQERASTALAEQDEPRSSPPWAQMLRNLPWKRLIGGAAALFALAMALILAFELTTGRAVSSYTGGSSKTDTGTSIPGFDGRGGSGTDDEQDPQQDDIPQDEAPQDAPPQDAPPQDAPPQDAPPQDAPPQDAPPQDAPPAPQPPENPEG